MVTGEFRRGQAIKLKADEQRISSLSYYQFNKPYTTIFDSPESEMLRFACITQLKIVDANSLPFWRILFINKTEVLFCPPNRSERINMGWSLLIMLLLELVISLPPLFAARPFSKTYLCTGCSWKWRLIFRLFTRTIKRIVCAPPLLHFTRTL